MDLRILIAVALIACAQAFDVKRVPLIKQTERDSHLVELTSEQRRELVDPYPDYIRDVPTKEAKLGNVIDETEPESEGRVRRSPKEPATGKIVVSGNARKGSSTGGRTEGQIYVGGQIRFRRSAEEQSEPIVEEIEQESEGRVRRSPKEPVTGQIEVSGHARKGASTRGRTEGQIYVGGRIRFRRSAEEEQKDVEELVEDETEEQTQTRFPRSPKKGRGRVIVRGEAGQTRGGKPDAAVHLIGEYRFRRAAEEQPEPIVEETEQESEGRVRRSPKEPVTGQIEVSGNARKGASTGGRTEGQIYVGGRIRFRRSAEEEQKDVEELVEDETEEQTKTRFPRSPKKGRGRVIVRGEAGQTRGGKPDAAVHLIGEYRFRRSAEEEHKDVEELVEDETEEQTKTRFPRSPKKGRGRVIVRGEAGQTRGGKPDAAVHLIGEYRFRRSAEEEHKDVEELVEDETEEQTQTRFPRSPKKGRGRLILRGEAGQSTGRRADIGAHLIGEYRFRRAAEEQPEPIVEETEQESEGRVRRSPKEPVTGKIVVSGNARKGSSTRGKTEGQVYVGGQVRFRRAAEEAPKHLKELVHNETEDQSQTRFRRSPKKGRGRLILRGEAGQSTGRRADIGAHLIGEYRFRRSAEQELAHH